MPAVNLAQLQKLK